MNKKFFTLVALLGLFVSFGAQAVEGDKLVSGNYYYLRVNDGSGSPGYLAIHQKADSLVAYWDQDVHNVNVAAAAGDSALWSVVWGYSEVTGKFIYTIKNKVSDQQLSFSGNSNATGKSNKATMSGSLKFTGETNLEGNADLDPNFDINANNTIFYSYLGGAPKDSTLQLRFTTDVSDGENRYPISFVKTGGNEAVEDITGLDYLQLSFEKPANRFLSATELNAIMKGKGFQMFAFYDEKPILKGDNNPLSAVRFIAEGVDNNLPTSADTEVYLRAAKNPVLDAVGERSWYYAYTDTAGYNTTQPTATGDKMQFDIDTIPNSAYLNLDKTAVIEKSYFTFEVDPSNPNMLDSVLVRVYNSFNDQARPAGSLHGEGGYALQIDKFTLPTDKYILTTSVADAEVDAHTRISLLGSEIPSDMLDINTVYSVKFLNKSADYTPAWDEDYHMDALKAVAKFTGKYASVDLENYYSYVNAPSVRVPATQFVFNGTDKVTNREDEDLNFLYLYLIDGTTDQFTNGTDTLEIKKMDVDPTDIHVGYWNTSDANLYNKTFSLEYISSLLADMNVNLNADSLLAVTNGEALSFKFVKAVWDWEGEDDDITFIYDEPFGPEAVEDGVVQLRRQAYFLETEDGKQVLAWGAIRNYFFDASPWEITEYPWGSLTLIDKETLFDLDFEGAQPLAFLFRATANADAYLWHVNRGVYDAKFNVNSTTALLETVENMNANNNEFKIVDTDAAPYVLDALGHYVFTNGRKEAMTKVKDNFAGFAFLDEVTSADDFKLWVDTASTLDPTRTLYYILKGAERNGEELKGNFMRNMADSVVAKNYDYAQQLETGYLPKVQFVEAMRLATGGDSLLLNYASHAAEGAEFVTADSIGFGSDAEANAYKVNQFRFAIQKNKLDDGFFRIENNSCAIDGTTDAISYVAVQNNVLYLTPEKKSAMLVTMDPVEVAPTANDDAVEAGVQVYTNNGAVIVKGAAGKVVNITNVLGQTVVNKTAATDYESFAAAGVVIVKVDGKVFKVSTY